MESCCLICSTNLKNSASFLTEGEVGGNLFRTFLQFSQQFLSVPQNTALPLLAKVNESGNQVFCGGCVVSLTGICKLYRELCEVQLKLSWKLGQLGELIGNSKMETDVGNQVGGVTGRKIVEDFRSAIKLNCDQNFQNASKLETIINHQSSASAASSTSSNASVGICCEVEVNLDSKDSTDNVVESHYFTDLIGTSHFLCGQTSQETTAVKLPTNKVECHQCHGQFAHKYSLEKHLRSQHGIETTFSCSECRQNYLSRQELQNHRNEMHLKQKGREHFQSPKKKKSKKKEAVHKCPECNLQFSSEPLLLNHISQHRKQSKSRKGRNQIQHQISSNLKECCECGDRFPSNILYYHLKRAHGHGNRHVCPVCGKEFLFPTGLQRHMLHHGEKRFGCHVCQKKFSQFPTLRKHLETIHGQSVEVTPTPKKSHQPSSQRQVVNDVIPQPQLVYHHQFPPQLPQPAPGTSWIWTQTQ